MSEHDRGHFNSVAGNELDYVGWKAAFKEDTVYDVVRGYC